MHTPLILASASPVRARLLAQAGIPCQVDPARIDEAMISQSLLATGATPRDLADALAEAKARRVSARHPDKLTLGCDQVLSANGALFSKPSSRNEARQHLQTLSGKTHHLWSAAVLYDGSGPIWRHVGEAHMTMRPLTDVQVDAYLDRVWPGVSDAVGCYKVEESGIRLFSRIEGSYFTIQGLPLSELLDFLIGRGTTGP